MKGLGVLSGGGGGGNTSCKIKQENVPMSCACACACAISKPGEDKETSESASEPASKYDETHAEMCPQHKFAPKRDGKLTTLTQLETDSRKVKASRTTV